MEQGTFLVKKGLAEMLKGGVIMDVTTPKQAIIAEKAGAVAVMALERVPSDIRAAGGVARMANPEIITEIMQAVTIPVMAKARIGHFVEAQILEALKIDYIDESEVLTPADELFHINKHQFKVPFVSFAAGGIATPADAALMMQLGCDGIFVGSGIFKSKDPEARAKAIVDATTYYNDPEKLAQLSQNLGQPMSGLEIAKIIPEERMQERGW